MTHEIARIETETRKASAHMEPKPMHRIHCKCGRASEWYFSKATAREIYGAHQRAATARDASAALAEKVTGVR